VVCPVALTSERLNPFPVTAAAESNTHYDFSKVFW
jgi:hypothetical protein